MKLTEEQNRLVKALAMSLARDYDNSDAMYVSIEKQLGFVIAHLQARTIDILEG